ncbi:MAG: nickel pincer cofactor biosynthesis protein LarB [Gracilibacteraceae bacterium]|jgi:NCAIR mutase (PurE)-related protein|nr:nickel pincer cofactor biosynthesis protein LarB [Gracilibacteraceae bacterium]
MDNILNILQKVRDGELEAAAAERELRALYYSDMGFALVDTHRRYRKGFAEAIYCPGKSAEQVTAIARELRRAGGGNILATRASGEIFAAVRDALPDAVYYPISRLILLPGEQRREQGNVLVVSAGTADWPVAEEALITARAMGCRAESLADVGVAGLHRLMAHIDLLQAARVVIVAAGMDGALPSVVAGLVPRPVIAVPTSVGYGANFQGLAPLLAMLNSCATGVTVVNIDNGFGAGYAAALINMNETTEQ